jgi:hypothetical protein
MMATTIINSMRVKPCCTFLSILTPGDERYKQFNFEQRRGPVTGMKQAPCQKFSIYCKHMNLLDNLEDIW